MDEDFDPFSEKAAFHYPRIKIIRALRGIAVVLLGPLIIAIVWLAWEKKRHKAAKLLNDTNYCVKDKHIVIRCDELTKQYGQYN